MYGVNGTAVPDRCHVWAIFELTWMVIASGVLAAGRFREW
jgi:hypothetical protein